MPKIHGIFLSRTMQYQDILNKNRELQKIQPEKSYQVVVLSNITTFQLNEILEYYLRIESIPAAVNSGDFDNIIQDSYQYNQSNLVIIFWELCNVIDGLPYKIELFDDSELESVVEKVCLEIDLVLNNLQETSLVLFNYFNALTFENSVTGKSRLEKVAERLNQYLEERVADNVKLIDLGKIIAHVGIPCSIGFRSYYSSKTLYTVDFFKTYVEQVKALIMSANGKVKKAIIFDCDNTLWKGILGEDGKDGIDMALTTKDGAIFAEVQSIALALNKQGVIIGLCSKNNLQDVEDVLENHPDMLLRNEHISIKQVNWKDKASNLNEISKKLNIGLDSLVFVDDSVFEINLIREQLPDVTVLPVPKRLYNYPMMLRQNLCLFYNLSSTQEDKGRVEMYKNEEQRENTKTQYSKIEDYLMSLELRLTVLRNDSSIIARASQMSQKTNQFNLTTQRYTGNDIKNFLTDDSVEVFVFSVKDKFGDSGVSGLCIVEIDYEKHSAYIKSFLLSCRVLGRNIEYIFIDYLINYLKSVHVNEVTAKYLPTLKNKQVEDFWSRCSFQLVRSTNLVKDYQLNIGHYCNSGILYIKVQNGE